ncbi:hypothetical protein TNCV_1071061 [Trichonephila clavipes]|nr:hypothetical protein TNCV_1071061 [Trichonephila clavipes]
MSSSHDQDSELRGTSPRVTSDFDVYQRSQSVNQGMGERSVNEHNPFQDYVRYPNCSLTDHRFTIDSYVKSINSFWRP